MTSGRQDRSFPGPFPRITLAFALVAFGTFACSRADEAKEQMPQGTAPPAQALPAAPAAAPAADEAPSEEEMSLAALAADAHDSADHAGTKEKQLSAAGELSQLFFRSSAEVSPEALAVRQDLAARAAQLYLKAGDAREAERLAQAGIDASRTPSLLLATLLLARADAEEALGQKEKMRGSLVEALKINQQLLEKELSSP